MQNGSRCQPASKAKAGTHPGWAGGGGNCGNAEAQPPGPPPGSRCGSPLKQVSTCGRMNRACCSWAPGRRAVRREPLQAGEVRRSGQVRLARHLVRHGQYQAWVDPGGRQHGCSWQNAVITVNGVALEVQLGEARPKLECRRASVSGATEAAQCCQALPHKLQPRGA